MTSDWESGLYILTREDVDAVMVFLPVLDEPGFRLGEWRPYRDERSEVELPIGYCSLAPELQAFMETLYEHHWVYPMDWTNRAWQRRMFAIRGNPARMAKTCLETLRKMPATYARADRFCDDTWIRACEDGYVRAILRRIAEITARRPLPHLGALSVH